MTMVRYLGASVAENASTHFDSVQHKHFDSAQYKPLSDWEQRFRSLSGVEALLFWLHD